MNYPINATKFIDDINYLNEMTDRIYNDSKDTERGICTVSFAAESLEEYREALRILSLILEDYSRRSRNDHWEFKNGLPPKVPGIFIVEVVYRWIKNKDYDPEKKEFCIIPD